MTENQKLREALQAISHIDDTTNHSVDASAALDRIGQIARQALSLPTADHFPDARKMVVDHIPDAGKMIETAAPVGERELPPLPSYARWEERIKMLMQQCGHPNSMSIYQAFKQFQNEFEHEMIAYARAALSAGDAVDGPLIDEGSKPALSPLSDKDAIALIEEHTNDDNVLHAHEAIELIRSVERAHGIDTAMRKGQL